MVQQIPSVFHKAFYYNLIPYTFLQRICFYCPFSPFSLSAILLAVDSEISFTFSLSLI